MTKYQSAVLWLGLALVFVRFLTTGQRTAFHNILTSGGNTSFPTNAQPNQLGPLGSQINQGVKAATANVKSKPKPVNNPVKGPRNT